MFSFCMNHGLQFSILCFMFIVSFTGLNVVRLSKYNNVFTKEEIEDAIKQHKPTAVFLTYAETITGVLQPLEGLGELCHR